MTPIRAALLLLGTLSLLPSPLPAACLLPDNGAGTVDLPPDCPPNGFQGQLQVVQGLPPGSTLEMAARILGFASTQAPGGSLGGTVEIFTATIQLEVQGTGTLAGFTRTLMFPVNGELHAAPFTPGASVQSFAVTMHRLRGKLTGDFDFWLLEFEGGDVYGLDSPGHTVVTDVGGSFLVDSFFDFNYRIQFEGAQESLHLEGWRGITLDLESRFAVTGSATATRIGPARSRLLATPSPTSGATTLSWVGAPLRPDDAIRIFDPRGRLVRNLALPAGASAIRWDGHDAGGRQVPSGVYWARAGGSASTTAIVIRR